MKRNSSQTKVTRITPFGLLLEPNHADGDIRALDVAMLRKLVWSEQLIVLRGFRTFSGPEDLLEYCARWGNIVTWPFGKVLELVEHKDPQDQVLSNDYVPLHWDGMYRPPVPEFQIFHCVGAPRAGQGGRTTFSNTVLVLEQAPAQRRALWKKAMATYQRHDFNLKTVSPIVDSHPRQGISVIRYSEPQREKLANPQTFEFSGISGDDLIDFDCNLLEALYSSNNFYAHEWKEGDVVVADNFSLLHGREAFETKAPRHLRRVHVL